MEGEGLIFTRQAHVIGGGHRKRSVVHLTDEGRQNAEALAPAEAEVGKPVGEILGSAPSLVALHGRDEELEGLVEEISHGATLQLVGLPGIGKTSLLRALGEAVTEMGWTVRWSTIGIHHDVGRLMADLLGGGDAPKDGSAALSALRSLPRKTLLVVDELQSVHSRHQEAVNGLLNGAAEDDDITLAIGCRAPSPIEAGEVVKVDEIAAEAARSLLPEDLDDEDCERVVSALGGHPLALKLWEPGDALPEADDRIQAFIQSDVIERLEPDALATMDELAAAPRPLYAEQLANDDGVAPLDEAALLRWSVESLELQHLIRNVRRTMWSDEEARQIHAAAASHWESRAEPAARIHEAHHRIQSADESEAAELVERMELGIDGMLSIDSAATAAIVDDAIRALPSAHRLKMLSAKVAIERGEGEVAEKVMDEVPEAERDEVDWALLSARIARLRGRLEQAEKLEDEALKTADPARAARIRLNSLVLRYDDRLPGPLDEKERESIGNALASYSPAKLDPTRRKAALVTVAAMRHSLALDANDAATASQIRADLAATATTDDPFIQELAARAALRLGGDPTRIRSLISRTRHPLRKTALGLLLVRHEFEEKEANPSQTLEQVSAPADLGSAAARRLSATHWYWRGRLDRSQRVKCWQEALHRYGMAECSNAYAELTRALHDEMRKL
jgi:ABC-type transport system involved in cytochrome c biogenesis ATPase subunit